MSLIGENQIWKGKVCKIVHGAGTYHVKELHGEYTTKPRVGTFGLGLHRWELSNESETIVIPETRLAEMADSNDAADVGVLNAGSRKTAPEQLPPSFLKHASVERTASIDSMHDFLPVQKRKHRSKSRSEADDDGDDESDASKPPAAKRAKRRESTVP